MLFFYSIFGHFQVEKIIRCFLSLCNKVSRILNAKTQPCSLVNWFSVKVVRILDVVSEMPISSGHEYRIYVITLLLERIVSSQAKEKIYIFYNDFLHRSEMDSVVIASELSKYMRHKHLNVGVKRVRSLLNEICLTYIGNGIW